MGADLIGYFAKGPRKLDRSRADAATADLARRLDDLHAMRSLCDKLDQASDSDDVQRLRRQLYHRVMDSPWNADDDPEPTPIEAVDWDMLSDSIGDILHRLGDWVDLTAPEIVERFIKNWPPHYRDTASMPDPDHPRKVIVFAGERSWGDTPEGAGFTYLDRAATLGIAADFDVWIGRAFCTLRLTS
jgi:hypothetical protein